jgi:hypothetical protein
MDQDNIAESLTPEQDDLLEAVAGGEKWFVTRRVADAVDAVLQDHYELGWLNGQMGDKLRVANADRDRAIQGQKDALARAATAEQRADVAEKKAETLCAILSAALGVLSRRAEEVESLKDDLYIAGLTTAGDIESIDALRDVARGWMGRALRAEQDLAAMTRHAGEAEERNLLNGRKAVEYQVRFEKYKAKYEKADAKLTVIWNEAGSPVR